jgi:hypothetical protein
VTRLRERLKEAAAAQTAYEECKTERDALAAELADLYPGVVQQLAAERAHGAPGGRCRLPTRFGQMPVAHDPLVTVRGKLVGMATE